MQLEAHGPPHTLTPGIRVVWYVLCVQRHLASRQKRLAEVALVATWVDSKEELETGVCCSSSLRLPIPLLANVAQILPSVTHCIITLLVNPFLRR